jgi:hypothetical protein
MSTENGFLQRPAGRVVALPMSALTISAPP